MSRIVNRLMFFRLTWLGVAVGFAEVTLDWLGADMSVLPAFSPQNQEFWNGRTAWALAPTGTSVKTATAAASERIAFIRFLEVKSECRPRRSPVTRTRSGGLGSQNPVAAR